VVNALQQDLSSHIRPLGLFGVGLPSAPHRWANPGLNSNNGQHLVSIAGKIRKKILITDSLEVELRPEAYRITTAGANFRPGFFRTKRGAFKRLKAER
jgi:hypothetical protein